MKHRDYDEFPSNDSGYWVSGKENDPGACYYGVMWKNETDPQCEACQFADELHKADRLQGWRRIDYIASGYRHLHVAADDGSIRTVRFDGRAA